MNLGSAPLSDRDVILVDLAGTAENRRVMRAVARWIVRLDVFTKRMRGAPPPKVLVFAPAADGKSVEWPVGAELIFTDELLDLEAIRFINRWVDALATRLVGEAGLWPDFEGIGLGQLNLLQIQEELLSYGQVTESLRRLLGRGAGRCLIVSGYSEAAEAVRRDAEAYAREIHVRTPPRYRPKLLHRRTATTEPFGWDERLNSLKVKVLLVSESRPMAGLFNGIETHLPAAGLVPALRIQYDVQGRGLVVSDDVSCLHLPRPELVHSPQYDFRKALVAARALLQQFDVETDSFHPPLDLLISTLYTNVLPQQARHLAELRRIMRATQPELVVVGNDRWWLGMAAVLVARREGIPTLAIQDGVAWDTPIWTCSTADHVAVNGTQLGGLLMERGASATQISVVGQPRYDHYNTAAAERVRPVARRRLGLPEGAFGVLFATQPNQDFSYVTRVVHAILAVPEVQLLLRPHPSTSPAARKRMQALARNGRVIWATEGDIFDLLTAADLVVVQNSTVALEGALLGKPVITANLTGMPDVVPYARLGITTEAKDAEGVTSLVRRGTRSELPTVANDERAREGIYTLIGPTDGKAAQRVAELMGAMLAHNATR